MCLMVLFDFYKLFFNGPNAVLLAHLHADAGVPTAHAPTRLNDPFWGAQLVRQAKVATYVVLCKNNRPPITFREGYVENYATILHNSKCHDQGILQSTSLERLHV